MPGLTRAADLDGDGMDDAWEATHPCLDPLIPDSDLDADSDGLTSLLEYLYFPSLDPCLADTDGDALADGDEFLNGTNPWDRDTDDDGENDGSEVVNNRNPLDPTDQPEWIAITGGTSNVAVPFPTLYKKSRHQVIYLASEINQSASVGWLALNVQAVPSKIDVLTIRMKHTDLAAYGSKKFDKEWTTVFQGQFWLSVGGWSSIYFALPFAYDGTGNLMIDFSVDNEATGWNGLCRNKTGVARTLLATSDKDIDPLTWNSGTISDSVPEIRLGLVRPPITDSDGDQLSDEEEAFLGTNPQSWDTDGDLISDLDEVRYSCLDPFNPLDADQDPDGDGLLNLMELGNWLNPCLDDTEGDGMSDGYEVAMGLDPLINDADSDYDGDGATNLQESIAWTNPWIFDTDGDGMSDGHEISRPCLDPTVDDAHLDADGDGLDNLTELGLWTNSCVVDTDGDLMGDGWEVLYGLNPRSNDATRDLDLDGLSNVNEYLAGTFPNIPDSDGDGMLDGYEGRYTCMDPLVDDTLLDYDLDGLSNIEEYSFLSNPCVEDTDGDGLTDFEEVNVYHCNPVIVDTDDDAMSDGDEVALGRDPLVPLHRVLLMVADGLYDQIAPALAQYRIDLEADGLVVLEKRWTTGTIQEMRQYLADVYAEDERLYGAVMIGSLPYAQYYAPTDNYNFPCDLYFMDLDGVWEDANANGIFDSHSGDTDLEIWVSRMKADNLPTSGNEVDLFNTYFSKDHRYRTGLLPYQMRGLVFVDIALDFFYHPDITPFITMMEGVYGVGNAVGYKSTSNFKSELMHRQYELVLSASHGMPSGVSISPDGVSYQDVLEIDPPWIFWLMFACMVCDYNVPDNMCATFAFNPDDSGLLTIGSTRPAGGSPSDLRFFDTLTIDRVIGVGYRNWFNNMLKAGGITFDNYYGVIIVGDGALKLKMTVGDYDHDGMNNQYENWNYCLDVEVADGTVDVDGDGLDNLTESQLLTNPCLADTDYDGMPDGWEVLSGDSCGISPFIADATADFDGDGFTNIEEYLGDTNPCAFTIINIDADGDGLPDGQETIIGTNPNDPDTDGDGLSDGQEFNDLGTNPLGWDTDGDALPDGFEFGNMSGHTGGMELDPLNSADGSLDYDLDGIVNSHDYWNAGGAAGVGGFGISGNGVYLSDKVGWPACGYWADGDGDGFVGPADASIVAAAIKGSPNFDATYPPNGESLDLDSDTFISPSDGSLLSSMIKGQILDPLNSRPVAIARVTPTTGVTLSGAIGETLSVIVGVSNTALNPAPGIPIIFSIDPSSTGAATILGGEGEDAVLTRYDLSTDVASGGQARVTVLLTGAGTVVINAKVAECGSGGVGRYCAEVVLSEPVVVTVNP